LQRDRDRANALTRAGYRILRFGWPEVRGRPGQVVEMVRSVLTELAHG